MSSTPEEETLESMHYEIVEGVVNLTETITAMHPDDTREQVAKMIHLFTGSMCAFIQSLPGITEEMALSLAKKAYETAQKLDQARSN